MKHLKQILFTIGLCLCFFYGYAANINYDDPVVITIADNSDTKKSLKGFDKKKIKHLIIKDQPGTSPELDFEKSYHELEKMPALKTLDVSACMSMNRYFCGDKYIAPLDLDTLILSKEIPLGKHWIRDIVEYLDNISSKELDLTQFPNLKKLVWRFNGNADTNGTLEAIPHELWANVEFDNGLVPAIFLDKHTIEFTKITNPESKRYNLILEGKKANRRISPANKLLDDVVVAHCSFVKDLPEHVGAFIIPSSVMYLLGDYTDKQIKCDDLIIAESDLPLYMEKYALYGFKNIKRAGFNRPIVMNENPGIFADNSILHFNAQTVLMMSNLGYGIKELVFNDDTYIYGRCAENIQSIIFNGKASLDQGTTNTEIFDDVEELTFKKIPTASTNVKFDGIKTIYAPVGYKNSPANHLIGNKFGVVNVVEVDFNRQSAADPRVTPTDILKIKPLKFNDPHISNVEISGFNRVLYFSTKIGKKIDGVYYVPVADNLYLTYSNENAIIRDGKRVEISCGNFYNFDKSNDAILNDYIMVFSYVPVTNIGNIEYGRTIGFYIANPKYGDVVKDFSGWALESTNKETPFDPSKVKKRRTTYHEHGRIEDCGLCLGTGMGWQGGICILCNGKGWYIEHEW